MSNTREFEQRQSVVFLSRGEAGAEVGEEAALKVAAFVAKKIIEWEGSKYTETSEVSGDITVDGIDPQTARMDRGGLLVYLRGVTPDQPMGFFARIGNWFKTLDRPDIDTLPRLDDEGVEALVGEIAEAHCGDDKCFLGVEVAQIRQAVTGFRDGVATSVKKELEDAGRPADAASLAQYGTPHLTFLAVARVEPVSAGASPYYRINLVGTKYAALRAKNLSFPIPFTRWNKTDSKLRWALLGPDGDPAYGGKRYAVETLQDVEWDRAAAKDRRSAWTPAPRRSQLMTVPPFQWFRLEAQLVESGDLTKELQKLADEASKQIESSGGP